jgi:chromosome segregation protein
MKFRRLKIAGFKSFADPVEFRFDDGLTGIIGPNGCGKSNFMEALRWVMGASSARALRGGEMDDVIFAGNSARPSRNVAEVSLLIDNSARRAPAAFNDTDIIEISRRITRGQGSTYTLNGREVRARDVQLLFADASTGANSPALVRQGQISELIAAKPQNRRRILEEAGGVAGLHTRRREAELRLKAASDNLQRLSDVMGEVEGSLNRFKREAKQAEGYKALSAEIRALELGLLTAQVCTMRDAEADARAALAACRADVAATTSAMAMAETAALNAADGLPALDEELTVATAVHQRAALALDGVDRDEAALRQMLAHHGAEAARLLADSAREDTLQADAATTLARLTVSLSEAEAASRDAPDTLTAAAAALTAHEADRQALDTEIEEATRTLARVGAERRNHLSQMLTVQDRAGRLQAELDEVAREVEGLRTPPAGLDAATTALSMAEAARADAVTARDAAHAAREAARTTEESSRTALREAESNLHAHSAEYKALTALTARVEATDPPPVMRDVRAEPGYEAALAAAIGTDLNAALLTTAPRHWAGADVHAQSWPDGVEPLAPHVDAPPALAARLAAIGVCADGAGARLMPALHPGQRLVSRAGQMWRWDGYVATTEAPIAAQLTQKNQLAALEAARPALEAAVESAKAAYADAQTKARAADAALRTAEATVKTSEAAEHTARRTLHTLSEQDMRRTARLEGLGERSLKLAEDLAEARAAVEAAQTALSTLPSDDGEPASLTAARARRVELAATIDSLRAEITLADRERDARARRITALTRDIADWQARHSAAQRRIAELTAAHEAAVQAEANTEVELAQFASRRTTLAEQVRVADDRLTRARDARTEAEAKRAEAERTRRAAEAAASDARAALARAEAVVEAATERLTDATQRLMANTGQDIGPLDGLTTPALPADAELALERLKGKREAMGPVNLRAAEELAEAEGRITTMRTEYDDLTSAIDKLKRAITTLNVEARTRLAEAFEAVNGHFQSLFQTLFQGGEARLELIEADDPLDAGLEIYAQPPGKRLTTLSLLSGGEQALVAVALIFSVFLVNPAPLCTLDEVDAPLDDANVDRFCRLLEDMRQRADSRFIVVTHNPVTMARVDRLYGVTMAERGVSQVVTIDLLNAEHLMAG